MPAPEWLLAVFTVVAAGSVSRSCVDGWLSGISFLVPQSSKKEEVTGNNRTDAGVGERFGPFKLI
jgi:hypothetical protein